MERNAYAPPVAQVADPVEESGERPPAVVNAVRILWISLGLGILGLFLGPLGIKTTAQGIGALIGAGLVCAIWAWLITKIASGRNWARRLFLVLLVIGTILTVTALPATARIYAARPVSAGIALVQTILQFIAFYFLVTAPAREWFNRPRILL
jgi:heme/copper-type cytochrome/quinol oxidase subunit 4